MAVCTALGRAYAIANARALRSMLIFMSASDRTQSFHLPFSSLYIHEVKYISPAVSTQRRESNYSAGWHFAVCCYSHDEVKTNHFLIQKV